jgi:7-alpha-hydroxysteroid dehydrogenase
VILDDFRLTDQVAIVTGAGAGIGRAIAIAFAEAGADVAVAARTQADLDETVRLIDATGRQGRAVVTDVMQEDDLGRLVDTTVTHFGKLSILVNNAGGTLPRASMQTSSRYFTTAVQFNALAPFLLSKLAAQAMVDTQGGGSIVNVSSRSGDMAMTSMLAYGAGKAALNMVTQNMAAELAPQVRINAISVGGVDTQAMAFVMADDGLRTQFESNTPMGRIGKPRDIAAAALYLASPASSWVTGVILRVDGGTTSPSFEIPAPPIQPREAGTHDGPQ